jgi:hypothetical protein
MHVDTYIGDDTVTGFGLPRVFKTLGLKNATVNGLDTACVVTPVCVPPSAETTNCLALESGGAPSSVKVYVGLVKPVIVVGPTTGLVGLNMRNSSKSSAKRLSNR